VKGVYSCTSHWENIKLIRKRERERERDREREKERRSGERGEKERGKRELPVLLDSQYFLPVV
jgi:hypothetical protein